MGDGGAVAPGSTQTEKKEGKKKNEEEEKGRRKTWKKRRGRFETRGK